jgi:phosphatidate cytidylyltransferase
LGWFFGGRGLQAVCLAAIFLGTREYTRMIFPHLQMPKSVIACYWICVLLALALFYRFAFGLESFAVVVVIFCVATLWLGRDHASNENLLAAVALGAFGLLYCALFPVFALRLVLLDEGSQWFLFLLLVVFFGDTFAYFGGRWFGKRKLMPQVSPNKTWAGAASGLGGSALAGLVHVTTTFQDVPWPTTLVFCLICGACAQSGDLLISLIKRVAHVKDSGHIMPGHGGILDRLDGIFIACPLVYAFALYVRPV